MAYVSPFSYDPTTNIGLIRLYVPGESNVESATFNDTELQAFFNVYNDVRLAAADALDQLASSTAKTQQKVNVMGMSTDGPSVSSSFREQAKRLRDRVDKAPYFDWAEQVVDAFTERERYIAQFLRGDF